MRSTRLDATGEDALMKSLLACFATLRLLAAIAYPQEPMFKETRRAKADHHLGAYRPVKGLSGNLRSAGTDTMENYMKRWIAGFRNVYSQISLEMKAKGSLTQYPALTECGA